MRRPTARIIASAADIHDGVRHLRRACPVMLAMHERVGDPPLRRYRADLTGLARIVVGQQLSIASADAIWRRVTTAVDPLSAANLLSTNPSELSAAGLSAAKIRTLRAIAEAVVARDLAFRKLPEMPEEAVRDMLTAITGIGPWTADIFLMFCLGRADAWAPGDLALQVGAARAFGAAERLSQAELAAHAEPWRPWRGVAARLIWADYALSGKGAGAPVGDPARIKAKPAPRWTGPKPRPIRRS